MKIINLLKNYQNYNNTYRRRLRWSADICDAVVDGDTATG